MKIPLNTLFHRKDLLKCSKFESNLTKSSVFVKSFNGIASLLPNIKYLLFIYLPFIYRTLNKTQHLHSRTQRFNLFMRSCVIIHNTLQFNFKFNYNPNSDEVGTLCKK